MAQDHGQHILDQLLVRTYRPDDQPGVAHLYTHGLLAGQLAPNDTGADIENIHDGYFTDPMNHFWVAELSGKTVGMIGVSRDEGQVAEIRRLRVEKELQESPIAARLIETALAHCKHHGYLKVVLDTRLEHGTAQELFEKVGFHHTRTKNVHGKELLEFYLDLYRAPKREKE